MIVKYKISTNFLNFPYLILFLSNEPTQQNIYDREKIKCIKYYEAHNSNTEK